MINKYYVLSKYKDFLKTMVAGAINVFGDSFDALALSLLMYEVTGSKYWFALNFAINSLPNLIIQPFMGAWIERLSKKWVMVIADCGRGILVLVLIALYSTNILSPWIILGFSFLMTTLEAFRVPAAMAVMPNLVDAEDYDVATSLKQSSTMLVQVAGTALAGTVIAMFGIATALWVDAVSFALSAIILASIKSKELQGRINTSSSYIDDLKEGFKYFIKHDFIMKLAIFGSLITLLATGFNVMLIPYLIESLSFNPQDIAMFNTILMAAVVLGSLSYPLFHKTVSNHLCFSYGILGVGFFLAGVGFAAYFSNKLIVFLLAAGIGFGQGVFQSSLSVGFVSYISKDQLSRAGALFNSFSYAAAPLGSLLISLVITVMSVSHSYIVYGILITLIGVFLVRDRQLKKMK